MATLMGANLTPEEEEKLKWHLKMLKDIFVEKKHEIIISQTAEISNLMRRTSTINAKDLEAYELDYAQKKLQKQVEFMGSYYRPYGGVDIQEYQVPTSDRKRWVLTQRMRIN